MKKEKGLLSKIKKLCVIGVSFLSVIFMALLTFSSFVKTSYANNMIEQKMIIGSGQMLSSLIFIIGTLVIGFIIIQNISEDRLNLLLSFTLMLQVLGCVLMIVFFRSAPGADALTVYTMAGQLADGDMSFYNFSDSYLSFYPQQIGLIVFLSMLIKGVKMLPFNLSPHHYIKAFYCVLNCMTIVFGYKTVKEIWDNEKISAAFLLLTIINIPFLLYSSFIYGETPSLAAMSVAAYFLSKAAKMKKAEIVNLAVSSIFLALSVFLRKNSLIFVIAYLITLILVFMEKRKLVFLLFAVFSLVISISILPVTEKIMEKKAGEEIGSGVTMYSYLAMGMQEGARGPGWYNAFNFDTYLNTGMDTEKTNEIASEAIKERKEYFKENPKKCFAFYRDKFLTQWSDPTLASLQATHADFGGRSPFVTEIYEGAYYNIFVTICNLFQNVVCIGAFVWSIFNLKTVLGVRKFSNTAFIYLGIITILGGFMFHMIWEANSRYIYPYAMMLIPYAASGLGSLCKHSYKFRDYED